MSLGLEVRTVQPRQSHNELTSASERRPKTANTATMSWNLAWVTIAEFVRMEA